MLTEQAMNSLFERGITKRAADECKLQSVSQTEIKSSLGLSESANLGGDGFEIPYFYANKPALGSDGVAYSRFRIQDDRTEEELAGAKRNRYLQRANSGYMPYVPLNFADADYLVITEGELKAISSNASGIPCIAISGVDSWADGSRRDKATRLSTDTAVHPFILEKCDGKKAVVVLADSDAATKKQVAQSMQRLAHAISKQAGVATIYKCIPTKKG